MLDRVRRVFHAGAPAPTDDFWYEPLTRTNAAGARVSAETAMRVAIVFASPRPQANRNTSSQGSAGSSFDL